MKVLLLRECRIRHNAGEIVEVSPAEADYLLSTFSAQRVAEAAPARVTPEDAAEAIETPETAAPRTAARKTTRKK